MPSATRPTITVLLVGLFLLTGCERENPSPPAPPASQPAAKPSADEMATLRQGLQDATASAEPQLPPGHPPLTAGPAPDTAAPTREIPHPLKYQAPSHWQRETPASRMRIDQFRLPRAAGDPDDGQLTVFYFGIAGGGGIDENVRRWQAQFTTPDGKPLGEDACSREVRTINNLQVTVVEANGRYNPGMMAGGPAEPQDGYHLLGAIVETPAGPWFFKAVGPAKTMEEQRASFLIFLETMSVGE